MNKKVKGLLLTGISCLILTLTFYVKKSYENYTIVAPKDSSIAIYVEGNNGYEMYNSELLPTSGYTFNASESSCINGATLSYNSNNQTINIESISSNTQCNIYFDKAPVTLASYIIDNVPVVTSGAGLYHHTSDTTATDYVANSAEDDSYRYAGDGGYQIQANNTYSSESDIVNNWLCFGESDGTNCSINHQWRIIGIMSDGLIKIIKASSIGNIAFDDTSNDGVYSNSWTNSVLKAYLNGSGFFNNSTYLDENMKGLLVTVPIWNVGASSNSSITSKQFNDNELLSQISTGGTIALMSASDYGFAASENNWSTFLINYGTSAYMNNWLYLPVTQWTMSPHSYSTFGVNYNGYIDGGGVEAQYAIRPVAFLKSTVLYTDGDGTMNNMYTITSSN